MKERPFNRLPIFFFFLLLQACNLIFKQETQLSIDDILQILTKNGPDKETFLINKDFKLISNENGSQSFTHGTKKIDGQELSLETIDIYVKKGFTEYSTIDNKHYTKLIEELKQKVTYKKEVSNNEGTTWQTYEKDTLWAATTISNNGATSKYIIRVGNYRDMTSLQRLPSYLSGTWARTGDVLEEGTYQFNSNGTLTFNEKLSGNISGNYQIDYSKNEITIAYNTRVGEYGIRHRLSGTSQIIKVNMENYTEGRIEGVVDNNSYRPVILKKINSNTNEALKTSSLIGKTGYIEDTDGSTNLREQPTASSNLIQKLSNGTVFTVMSQSNGWVEIKLSDGTTGYVHTSRIKLND